MPTLISHPKFRPLLQPPLRLVGHAHSGMSPVADSCKLPLALSLTDESDLMHRGEMIVNLPTSEALNATALKLYFRAWHGIVSILHEFDQIHVTDAEEWLDPGEGLYFEEREEYLEVAQEDLHAILAIVQQSNEIALKARIVGVSPYLLLLNNDVAFGAAGKDIEFSSLRTLDAVDLPRAVNTLTKLPVGQKYVQRYEELRVQRNQYAHLGDTSVVLDPIAMCAAMAEQYLELWPGRPWLEVARFV